MTESPLPAEIVRLLSEGLTAHQSGRLAEAESAYRAVLERIPAQVDARHLLGIALHQRGQNTEAMALLAVALEARPDSAEIANHYGCAVLAARGAGESVGLFRRTLVVAPGHAEALFNLGRALETIGDLAGACDQLTRAVTTAPGQAAWHSALATVETTLMRFETARPRLERLVRSFPSDISVVFQRARLAFRSGCLAEGARWYRRAVILQPDRPEPLSNLAHVERVRTRTDHAVRFGAWAVQLRPADPSLNYTFADSLLAHGVLEEGWRRFAWRNAKPEVMIHRTGLPPAWDGGPLQPSDVLLVAHEQGIGDEVRFLSCLPDLVDAVPARILVECEPRLRSLLQRSLPTVSFFDKLPRRSGPPISEDFTDLVRSRRATRHILLGDLPVIFRRGVDRFPKAVRYLEPASEDRSRWRSWLAGIGPTPKIGICWRTGRRDPRFVNEDPRIADLEPLLRLDGVDFVNLQYDECSEELREAEIRFGVRIHQPAMNQRDDLANAVALIDEVDLVVAFTTSVLVFAGAVGTPAIGLCFDKDWKFMGQEHDPWFPNERDMMRGLFKDWRETLEAAADLARRRLSLP